MKKSVFLFGFLFFYASVVLARTPELGTVATWWWHGQTIEHEKDYLPTLNFLEKECVDEIYLCIRLETPLNILENFVKTARAHHMRVSWLAGDVSWIFPKSLGFYKTFSRYLAYQRSCAPENRLVSLHLDVEPHQDNRLSQERRWQLYADFVVRAYTLVHSKNEKLVWDIPFWLERIHVEETHESNVPLLDLIFRHADGVALMSYRDQARAILQTGTDELAYAQKYMRAIIFGAETGRSSENQIVTFYEEGARHLRNEIAFVREQLAQKNLHGSFGVAIHHVKSWMELPEGPRTQEASLKERLQKEEGTK